MKHLEEITRYAIDDYARILASRVDLLLPVDNSRKGYDSVVITRFVASLKAQIAAYLQWRRRDDKHVYPYRPRYAQVKEFGGPNDSKHYHVLLLVNWEVFRNTMLNAENSAQPRGLLVRMVARTQAMALGRTRDMANKVPFHLLGISCEPDHGNGINTGFFRNCIYHINYLVKKYTKSHDDDGHNFGYSQG